MTKARTLRSASVRPTSPDDEVALIPVITDPPTSSQQSPQHALMEESAAPTTTERLGGQSPVNIAQEQHFAAMERDGTLIDSAPRHAIPPEQPIRALDVDETPQRVRLDTDRPVSQQRQDGRLDQQLEVFVQRQISAALERITEEVLRRTPVRNHQSPHDAMTPTPQQRATVSPRLTSAMGTHTQEHRSPQHQDNVSAHRAPSTQQQPLERDPHGPPALIQQRQTNVPSAVRTTGPPAQRLWSPLPRVDQQEAPGGYRPSSQQARSGPDQFTFPQGHPGLSGFQPQLLQQQGFNPAYHSPSVPSQDGRV